MRLLALLALLLPLQEKSGWKQLEEALRPPGQKHREILIWPNAMPLAELSSRDAAGLLGKFAATPADLGLSSPVQRALAQHLLWAFFDGQLQSWRYFDPGSKRNEPAATPKQEKPEQTLRPAARLLRGLALTEAEIRALPDPYRRTVESRKYPATFDPMKPSDPFLPADLWDPEGPWISLGNSTDEPLAVRHTRYFGGRSSFQIFLRVPDGRAAGLELLRSLRGYVGNKPYDPPRIPAGTHLVLVEQQILISDTGTLVPSPLVETVEMRVVLKPEVRMILANRETAQALFRFRLRPDLLIADDPAPLRARGKAEEDWEPTSHLVEQGRTGGGLPFAGPSTALCATCHSFSQAQTMGIFEIRLKESGTLEVIAPPKERERVLKWKEQEDRWKELRSYWN